jgi:hypothetical protein
LLQPFLVRPLKWPDQFATPLTVVIEAQLLLVYLDRMNHLKNQTAASPSGYGCFIRKAAEELQTAIFTDCSDSHLLFPASVVRILQADDFGHIYFFLHKPFADVSACAHVFPACLQFYNRAHAYRMKVEGRVVLLPPDFLEECPPAESGELLVRMHIRYVEYCSGTPKPVKQQDSRARPSMKAWHYLQRLLLFAP